MGRPTAAERARTIAYGVAGGGLVAPGVQYSPVAAHVTDDAGRSLLLIPAESGIVSALSGEFDLPATLRISDVAPLPLADRIRGQVWLHGWLTELPREERRAAALLLAGLHPCPELLDLAEPAPAWTVLALEVGEVEISDGWSDGTVQPEEYAAARPDPFVAVEGGMLAHLDACHPGELAALLRGRLVPGVPAPAVRPLGLDRHGMWLRCLPATGPDGAVPEPFDVRVEFPGPVADLPGLRRAYRRLLAVGSDLRG
ncbi:DUF2470 domain-containing protein [Actinomadura sp. HBU206391]|uniref:DUF2470 domain-containing protein n=1 Tax=Actinomadura sp. HBU206391 TaxID=2731692 RepID=UPI001C9CE024|nr:DUF2470 domain-containing protein [Actinomadura sp. HBU206391]